MTTRRIALQRAESFQKKLANLMSPDEQNFVDLVNDLEGELGSREAALNTAVITAMEEWEVLVDEVLEDLDVVIDEWVETGNWPDMYDPTAEGQIAALFRNYIISEGRTVSIDTAIDKAKRMIMQGRREVIQEYVDRLTRQRPLE